MSRDHAQLGHQMAMCTRCGSDLEARAGGGVYCTSRLCRHYKEPHPTRNTINSGKEVSS